jgi:hypothetical protein
VNIACGFEINSYRFRCIKRGIDLLEDVGVDESTILTL